MLLLTEEKIKKSASIMNSYRYQCRESIFPLSSKECTAKKGENHHTAQLPKLINDINSTPVGQGYLFKGRDKYLWLQKEVSLPQLREGYELVGLFDFGKTGSGYNSGFESLIYVDGKPYQGVDTNHNEVLLSEFAGKKVEISFLLWTGLEGGGPHQEQCHCFKQADIAFLHKDTDKLYYYLKTIDHALEVMSEDQSERYFLSDIADKALSMIDWDQECFYETVSPALNFLEKELLNAHKRSNITINCVGHTHIDVAWLWQLKHSREKTIRSFSTVLKLMDQYDEFVFLQTQPQLYSFLKTDCPEIFEKIKKKVSDGKWETDGGMWLEADCNLTSGESLVRQLLYGTRFIKEEFGLDCEYLWLPDAFGFNWALPQILKQCNIKTFMTTKISWNQFNHFPNDLFYWRGLDGSEILTYFITTPDPDMEDPMNCGRTVYNGFLNPSSVTGAWHKFQNKNLSHELLLSYGYGDGGGGVTRDMLETRRVMDILPGLPNIKPAKALTFFHNLHENLKNSKGQIPVWDGELYLEYHRGTYTTQSYIKKMNRYFEINLALAEWLSCLAMMTDGSYPADRLHQVWETVLRNQFHDILPGSAIKEVYEDSKEEYENAKVELSEITGHVLKKLVNEKTNAFCICNHSPFPSTEVVFIPVLGKGAFKTADGLLLPSQATDGGRLVTVSAKPFGFTNIYFEKDLSHQSDCAPFKIDLQNNRMETPFYILCWNENGQFTNIFDKENSREVLDSSGLGNTLELYEDQPLNFDAWDIDIFYNQKREYLVPSGIELIENGDLRAVLRFKYAFRNSSILQDVIFYNHSRRIDFKTNVDWHESHRLLKAGFDINVRTVKASYDIQFGFLERPTHSNTSWDYAKFESIGHFWADLSDNSYGVSLLNNCKYGYGIKDKHMTLSLLKSSKEPDPTADMGFHEFTYSLLPHSGALPQCDTIQQGHALNNPLLVTPGEYRNMSDRLIYCDHDGIAIDAVKKSEDDDYFIVRLHECKGMKVVSTLKSDFHIEKWVSCNLLEQDHSDFDDSCLIPVNLNPFEIQTYKIMIRPALSGSVTN